jgi:homoserine O-acetyltransferase
MLLNNPLEKDTRNISKGIEPTQHEFIIENFRTEGGANIPKARIIYSTYGQLNDSKDNAVLLPGHFMADMTGYEWLIGPHKALNPNKYFLITTELFGNGRSSSPSNTAEPLHGPRFPLMTIRDNVNAVHELLVRQLNLSHLKAVIGFSMGAQQAFQWAVSFPDFMDRIVATSGTAKTYGHGVVRLEGQIAALTLDPKFNDGNYTEQPENGLRATSMVWTAWLHSQPWWREELWRTKMPAETTFPRLIEDFRKLFSWVDANDLILQMRTWQSNDIGNTPGFQGNVEAALRSIKVPVLYMPSTTDMYFPETDASYEAGLIPRCSLVPIVSLWGHPAGAGGSPADSKFVNERISDFMK